jgi:hypothetical protein
MATIVIIGILIGATLGLRFKFLILLPAIGLAGLGIACAGIAHGDGIGLVVLTVVVVATALQVGYLAGIVTRAVWVSIRVPNADVPRDPSMGGQLALSGIKSLDVQNDMEVVGSDGEHVGTVDQLESSDRIILTKDDPNAGGRPHLISIKWVDYVDTKIHLDKPAKVAMTQWQVAA